MSENDFNELIQKIKEQETPVGENNVLYDKKKREIEKTLKDYDNCTPNEVVHPHYLDVFDYGKTPFYYHEQNVRLHEIATALIENMHIIEEELRTIIDVCGFYAIFII
jgi:hypothetical protein